MPSKVELTDYTSTMAMDEKPPLPEERKLRLFRIGKILGLTLTFGMVLVMSKCSGQVLGKMLFGDRKPIVVHMPAPPMEQPRVVAVPTSVPIDPRAFVHAWEKTGKTCKLAILLPEWERDKGPTENSVVQAYKKHGEHLVTVNVVCGSFKGPAPDMWSIKPEDIFNGIRGSIPGTKMDLLDSGYADIGNQHAIWVRTRFNLSDGTPQYCQQYMIAWNGQIITVSLGAPGEDVFKAHQKIFKDAVDSFRLIETTSIED